ncbi:MULTISPECIES: restriction endonuclease [unclassified Anabaena]|uniref:restriction endonuclease n=1 Tax=unclassified Anabaena TaxID=2619674 RepID=UPI0020C53137|nr:MULTISPECIES: restriction endonuclease [unclassified Anabaena]
MISTKVTIPDFQSIMLPLLQYASDGKEHSLRDAVTFLADIFNLSDEEKKGLLPSGQQTVFDNRVGWARTHLKKAVLLEYPKRGFFQITDRGKDVLIQNPSKINIKFLNQFSEHIEFLNSKKDNDKSEPEIPEISETTPHESIEFGYQKIRKELELELLNRVKSCSPDFFERLVVDLLVKMGYGGSRRDAGRAIGKSGDGGIDGIIKEDKLGLDIVYIQAKKWDNTVVGRPEIQKFVGALHGQRARKGVFITTSRFSQEAREYVSIIDSKIVLVDGQELAQLMIDNQVGVSTVSIYEIKKIDSDYFTDE